MTLIEKMARAMAGPTVYDADNAEFWLARALRSLEAIREPTDEMAEAGLDELLTHLGPGAAVIRDPVYCWRAMVNAAILQQKQ